MHEWKVLNERPVGRRNLQNKRQLVPLCFKVPAEFRHWLKTQAVARNLTMTELLVTALVRYDELNPSGPLPLRSEIRK